MPTTRHDLTDPVRDLPRLRELTSRLWPATARWHVGELVWNRFLHLGREKEWPTAWWQDDEGTTVAWGWTSLPDALDLQVDPAYPVLADEVLDWFESVTTASPRTVEVLDAEVHLIEALRRRGYRRRDDGPFFIHLRRNLERLPAVSLPDGYRLRHVAGAADAAARAQVQRAAFTIPGYPPPRVSADSYRNLMRQNGYRADLDWLVETTGGEAVAFCLLWWDEPNRSVCLEPVGCHPDHRREGLASAASLAAMHAAHRLGARSARVCARGDDDYPSARALYQAMGFQRFARNLRFERRADGGRLPETGSRPPGEIGD